MIAILGIMLAIATGGSSKTANAASEYDDLVNKITTNTLINYVDNYYNKTCGSQTEDYAKRWLHQFKRQKANDRNYHSDAVDSLNRAISSTSGAYAVIYEQKNNHDNTSNPYFITVIWTETGRENLTIKFRHNANKREIFLEKKAQTYDRVYEAKIGSPALIQNISQYCEPEFMWGYTGSYSSSIQVAEDTNRKLFTSTFNVEYPEGYEGEPIPNDNSAVTWKPNSSIYDDLVDQVTQEKLINYIKNYYGKSCGNANYDFSSDWVGLFNYPRNKINKRPYHSQFVAGLEKAMASGAYAVAYIQNNSGDNRSSPYMLAVYWAENRDDFYLDFQGEKPSRYLTIVRTKGSNSNLSAAVIASPTLIQNIGGCHPEFLWGSYREGGVYGGWVPFFIAPEYGHPKQTQPLKIYKSTFKVKYPEGYKGKAIPGLVEKLDYLALGDSFSSGEGDTEKNSSTNQKYYRQFTDVNEDKAKGVPKEKCHISTRSYPYRLAQQMGLTQTGTKQWDTVACSGATIYDMNWDNSAGYEGQGSPLGRLNGLTNKDTLKGMALNEMIPGRVKQIEFVKKYQPKVITLTAGGNDVDFSGKLTACAAYPVTCNWATLSKRNELKNDLRNQFDKLKDFYNELKTASNHKAKIYVLGYPQFVNGEPNAKCKSTLNLDSREREMITNAVTYYNGVIKQAARAVGVKYVDIETALSNHRLCDQTESYVNGVASLWDLAFSGSELQESFHPNSKGHYAIAARFKEELRGTNPLRYENCPGTGKLYCPDDSANKKSIPDTEYFTVQNEDEDMRVVHYQSASGQAVKKDILTIKTREIPYKSLSPIKITLYSNPIELGEVFAGADGKIDSSVTIPATIPAGYHTLELSGVDEKGHKLNLYQTILIKGSNPEDIDENGTLDKNQPCGAFIQAANKDEDLDTIDDACDPEITDPILYTARNGNIELGEDEDRIYLFRNTRASELTGITNDYVDKSKNKDNTDALVGYTLDEETRGLAFEKLIIMKEDDTNISITKGTPIILAKDINDKCYALKPEDYLSPALKPGASNYKPRELTKLNTLPKGVKCEE